MHLVKRYASSASIAQLSALKPIKKKKLNYA